jgi:hypothetical protein
MCFSVGEVMLLTLSAQVYDAQSSVSHVVPLFHILAVLPASSIES